MDDAALRERAWASVAHQQRLFGTSVPGAGAREGDGWVASVVASAADSPLLNAIVPLRDGVLERALGELDGAFGPLRWGVWCDDSSRQDLSALRRAGFRSRLAPWTLMAAPLAELDLDGPAEGDRTDDLELVGAVNDDAYGLVDGRLASHFAPMPPDRVLGYRLDRDEHPVAVAAVTEHGFDAGVLFVATVPDARREGHGASLLRRLLLDARERGAASASLLATAMGLSLYHRLGLRELGAARLWER
jgi:ribosomal protein S18 acetylase RimI-like enzyme